MQGIWSHKTRKGTRIVKLDMASEKTMRVEEIEKGATKDTREYCPNDEKDDQFGKGERDY